MPLPKPNSGESHDNFISRCMSNPTMESEYPDSDQRYAVCESQWQNKNDMKNIPDFKTKKELFDFLVENKDTLIAQKKAQIKHADAIIVPTSIITPAGLSIKAMDFTKKDEITVKPIINTTNLLDNHKDLHIPGIWDKTLKDNKMIMHLQEHEMKFDHIIAKGDDLKAYTQSFTWKELGFSFEGKTEALVFESTIRKERNPFMFEQYAKGYVDQHSVGMYYIKILLAISDENYGAEFEAWEKYYPMVANKDFADEVGYMYVVKEAKAVEGSAVPLGSNFVTPTLDIKSQPPEGTGQEPSYDTLEKIIKESFKQIKI